MSDLQAETGPVEQPASEDNGHSNKTDFWTVATTFAIAFYIGWRLLDAMESEMIRAHILRMFVRLFANGARYMGEQALLAEQLYYDTVRAMN
jgi:divalent metal cation (Fe/Co/Zn/Cd) transporter